LHGAFCLASPGRLTRRLTVADDLANAIRENAEGPAEAHGDVGGMKQQLPTQQIEAAKFLAAKDAMGRKNLGLTRVKIIPPGTV